MMKWQLKKQLSKALTALQFGDIVGRNDIFTLDAMLAMQKGYRSFIDFSIVSLGHSFTDDELSLLKSQGTQINPQYIVYVTIKHDQFRSGSRIVDGKIGEIDVGKVQVVKEL